MKECLYCKVKIGGNLEKCPLCQNALTGEGERDHWPKIYPDTRRRKAFKIVTFCVIATCILSVAADYLFLKTEHLNFSPVVVAWLLITGWLLEVVLKRHYNILQTLFVSMITVSFLCQVTEFFIHFAWDVPNLWITPNYVIPSVCAACMAAGMVLSLVDKRLTEHSMIYTFMNFLVGVIPWIVIMIVNGKAPLPWSVCMVVNVLILVAFIVFRGKKVLAELRKRFHTE